MPPEDRLPPDRFQQIEDLYHAAREKSAAERVALLSGVDPDVRREVESLLEHRSGNGGEFLERPAIENAAKLWSHEQAATGEATLTAETAEVTLGPYRLQSRLGAGGMGTVYRAVDTRLGRAVAIKLTQEQFSERFEREARAISSLNHPNICTLFDVGPNYLVMELVDGETISARLKRGPLPIDEAVQYARQILAALGQAHERSIIHRDLKPGNIMLAKSGVKVLDFGLAKSAYDDSITASHMVMGTPAYMPPEQREGKPTDARSDIYSFGCVFYEMLTAARVGSQKRVPSKPLEKVVARCLEKNPAQRYQSVAEIENDLTNFTYPGGRWRVWLPAVAAVIVAACAGAYFYFHRSSATSVAVPNKEVVLADFVNQTGDPAFDDTLRQSAVAQLENSPGISLLSEDRVSQALASMVRPANTKLTSSVAAEVCERANSTGVVDGTLIKFGSEYALSLRARDCRTGAVLEQERATAAKKDDVFSALAQMTKRFGSRLNLTLPPVEKESILELLATTSSLDAFRAYRAAMNAFQSHAQTAEIIPLLKRAVEIDPDFAVAYAHLSRSYADLGEAELAAKSVSKAYALRDRVSDQENYFITFVYHRQVSRNLEIARQALESWLEKYPDNFFATSFLSGFTSPGSGRYDTAIEKGLRAIELDSGFAIGYENVAWAYIYLNRPSDAEALLHQATLHKVEILQFSFIRYAIAFLRGDTAAMEREVTQRHTKLNAQGGFEHQEALTLAYQGRIKEANRLSDRALQLARQAGLPERAALFEGVRSIWNALFGAREEARSSATGALAIARGRDADYGPAFAFASTGDTTQAHKLVAELEKRYPEDTSVQFNYLPTVRALIALAEGNPRKALETTESARPYEFAVPATAYFPGAYFGSLYPVYARGLAYSRLGRHAEAAAEFQKILDHPGLMLNDPVGPMARLQLARALAASGDRAKSAATYKDLLALWKDADPDLPAVQQAKSESAKLH
jgi:eukaryotic-like serine/threonine-protein kinase